MTNFSGKQERMYSLTRVRGRSIGGMILATFGALWLALSAYAFGHLTGAVKVALATVTLALLSVAARLLRAVPKDQGHDPQQERDGRRFGWVNAGQGVAIFVAIQIANNLHHPDASFPAVALIVGLHFFVLPQSMRHRSTLVTGTVMTASALFCPLLFHGDTMVGSVTLCAGTTLWCSAAWALATAATRYRATRKTLSMTLSEA